jgi:hypothetical protein
MLLVQAVQTTAMARRLSTPCRTTLDLPQRMERGMDYTAQQITRVLEDDVHTPRAADGPEAPVSRGEFEAVMMNGIRSTQPSGHSTNQCMPPLLALPSSSTRAWNRYSSQVCASVCLAQGSPPPKRPSGRDRPARAGGTYRFAHLTPLRKPSLGSGSSPCFG